MKRLGIPEYGMSTPVTPSSSTDPFSDAHGHGVGGGHASHGPESSTHNCDVLQRQLQGDAIKSKVDTESVSSVGTEAMYSALAQIIGICILEFGVVLHRFVPGGTYDIDDAVPDSSCSSV